MLIYALIHPTATIQPCIQAFSTPELAHSARLLYGWNDLEVAELELHGQGEYLGSWSRLGSPVHLYFIPSDPAEGRSYAAFVDDRLHKEHRDALTKDLPWLDGTLDGLRRSVELGLVMYRVHMNESGGIGTIASGHEFGATTTILSQLNLLDPEWQSCHVGNCSEEARGRHFVYVFASNKEAAVAVAQPILDAHRRRPTHTRIQY